jgi:hypothetical protein
MQPPMTFLKFVAIIVQLHFLYFPLIIGNEVSVKLLNYGVFLGGGG